MRRTLVVLSILAGLVLAGCAGDGSKPEAGGKQGAANSLAGKKAVFIIAPRDFRDEELKEPADLLKARGCAVTIACSVLDTAKGMLGAEVKPDVLLKDVKADDFDAVVFVGGSGAGVYFDDPAAHALARDAAANGKIVAAICIAPSTLARAGLLKGKRATAWTSQRDDLETHGAKWSDGPAERDAWLVTGNGPKAAKEFGELLAQALGEPAKP